jgi:type IV secretory pathway VirB4 component
MLADNQNFNYHKAMNLTPQPKIIPAKIPFIIGTNSENQAVEIGNKNRFGNSLILGGTGTGKTNFMVNMLLQDVNNGTGVCFFDPIGDTIDLIISKITADKKDKILPLKPDLDFDTLDLDAAIKEDKIILVQAQIGAKGLEKTKKFNRGLTNLLIKAIEKRNKTVFNTRPFFVYMDEFQYLVSDKIIETIKNSQSHNVSFVLAHQFLAQLDKHDAETKNIILENCKSRFVFECGPDDAELLKNDFPSLEFEQFKCNAKINNLDEIMVLGCEEIK